MASGRSRGSRSRGPRRPGGRPATPRAGGRSGATPSIDQAVALLEHGRLFDAQAAGEAILAASPRDPNALQLLGMVASRRGRFVEAAGHFRVLTEVAPLEPVSWCRLGSAEMYGARFEEAAAAFEQALAVRPGFELAIRGLAELAERSGDPASGLERLVPLIEGGGPVSPDTALLHASLLVAAKRPDEARRVAEDAARRPDAAPMVRRKLLFTLGRAAHRDGDVEAAAAAWTRANAIGARPFDADAHDREIDAIIERFASAPDRGRSRATSEAPLLVVGMPRSGSTLVEQILDAHPKTAGTGESTALPEAMSPLSQAHAAERPFPAWWSDVPPADMTQAGAAYVAGLESLGPSDRAVRRATTRLVDKNLLNLTLLGAVAELVPNARFVICRRDPVDLGFSCWQNDLSPVGFPWSGDLEAIGRFTAAAERLIEHWPGVLGDRCLVVEYEALVADPEPWTRRLIEHAGLEWDDACLRPHESGRAVTTLSYDQVRQPIYRTAVRRSARYAAALAPLVATLQASGVSFTAPDRPESD